MMDTDDYRYRVQLVWSSWLAILYVIWAHDIQEERNWLSVTAAIACVAISGDAAGFYSEIHSWSVFYSTVSHIAVMGFNCDVCQRQADLFKKNKTNENNF